MRKRLLQLTAAVALLTVQIPVSYAQETGQSEVIIGTGAQVHPGNGVAIGRAATVRPHATVAPQTAAETIAIGAGARAEGWRCSAVGAGAVAGVVSATALGRSTYAWGPHMIAIGRGAHMEKIDGSPELNLQNACGIAGDSLWLGGRMAHKMIDRTGDNYIHEQEDGGDGKSRWDVGTFKPKTYTIHGMDAYDARFDQDPRRFDRSLYDPDAPATWTHREDKDVPGGDLVIAAGRGTGTGTGGVIELKTAAAGTVSQNRKNPLRTGLKIDTEFTETNATPMLLWDNQARRLKRVLVGPPDSGGPGFRALVIEN